jgi:hypothetical protein
MEFTSSMFNPRWTFVHSICLGSSCLPQNIHLGWMSPVNLVPPFGLQRPFFIYYGCNMKYIFQVLCFPSCMDNDTLSICVMGCVVSSPISINLGVFKSFVSKPLCMTSHVVWNFRIHILNIVIWYTSYNWICHVLHHK